MPTGPSAVGGTVSWAIITLAAVPAAAAAGVPLGLAVVAAGEVVAAFQLVGQAAVLIWVAAMALSVCLVALKFLMPLQAVQYCQQGLRPPMMIIVTWAFAIIASVAVVMNVGALIVARSALPNPSRLLEVCVLWASIEIVGTLAMGAALLRPSHGAPPPHPRDPPISGSTHSKHVSALSAEELLAWFRSMLATPEDKLPKGIEFFYDGHTLITSHRKLAAALNEPRTRVVRLLKRLEREGKVQLGTTHRDTYIHLPNPDGK